MWGNHLACAATQGRIGPECTTYPVRVQPWTTYPVQQFDIDDTTRNSDQGKARPLNTPGAREADCNIGTFCTLNVPRSTWNGHSTITNLGQSLLYLDLDRITGSDNNCTTAVESVAHAVDNTYKLCCPIKSKTLSNDFKVPWITHGITSNIKNGNIISHSTVKIKFLKIFILISVILSLGELDNQKIIILNINSMPQKKRYKSNLSNHQ